MTNMLDQLNQLLYAAVVIVTFSLQSYIALQNWRSDIVRALVILLGAVVVVYGGDLLLSHASRLATIEFLGRAQWLGIAFVPAGYVHLANALFNLSGAPGLAQRYRWTVPLSYAGSVSLLLLVIFGTDLIVRNGLPSGPVAQFQAGPLFWFYPLYLLVGAIVTSLAILQSRKHALTPTQRRRLSYLGATFAAPGIGVFPFLIIGAPTEVPIDVILILQAVASIIVIGMLTVMTYSVAFQGVLMPDRLIKHDFIRWWLYGPFVGVTIILFLQVMPILESGFGLPRDTLITFGVMIMTVLMPIFVSRIKPYLDALIYMQDHEEIDYLRSLPRNMFTRTDLRNLLENSLVAICGVLRVDTGFVAAPGEDGYTVKAVVGARREIKRFVAEYPLIDLIPQLQVLPTLSADRIPNTESFLACGGFCVFPLRNPEGDLIGALGFRCMPELLDRNGVLPQELRHMVGALAHQMELALATVDMQQRIFDTLRVMGPEMQSLQQLSSRLEQATPESLSTIEQDLLLSPDFPQLVKDALTQFWGGPKLSDSPLLGLRSVRRMLDDQGGSPTRALQAVLRQAIANLRPDEQLDPSAQEWLLYNLLEGRFLQRKTVRDVASRLSMSESDFYRKQRIAVEEVARQIAIMEELQ